MAAAQMLRSSPPTGPLTPPMTPLRAAAAGGLAGGLTPEAIAALLGQQQGAGGMQGNMGAPGGSQGKTAEWQGGARARSWQLLALLPGALGICLLDASRFSPPTLSLPCLPPADVLLGQLLGQLAGQQPPQQQPQTMALQQHQHAQMGAPQHNAGPSHASESDQAAIQALLAQAGLLGGGQQGMAGGAPTSGAAGMSAHALPASSPQGLPAAAALMLSATGAPAMVSSAGSERSYGATSPSQSASMPVAAPGSARSGLAQAAAPGTYLGTSPTATHSSAGRCSLPGTGCGGLNNTTALPANPCPPVPPPWSVCLRSPLPSSPRPPCPPRLWPRLARHRPGRRQPGPYHAPPAQRHRLPSGSLRRRGLALLPGGCPLLSCTLRSLHSALLCFRLPTCPPACRPLLLGLPLALPPPCHHHHPPLSPGRRLHRRCLHWRRRRGGPGRQNGVRGHLPRCRPHQHAGWCRASRGAWGCLLGSVFGEGKGRLLVRCVGAGASLTPAALPGVPVPLAAARQRGQRAAVERRDAAAWLGQGD